MENILPRSPDHLSFIQDLAVIIVVAAIAVFILGASFAFYRASIRVYAFANIPWATSSPPHGGRRRRHASPGKERTSAFHQPQP